MESGEWRRCAAMDDYRAEWLTDVLVERATWSGDAAERPTIQEVDSLDMARAGYVWTRFWLRREGQVVEKYFTAMGEALGYYIPVCMPIEQQGNHLSVERLGLALWVDMEGRVTVLGEAAFDTAVDAGEVAPVAQEHAEQRIRELTTLTAQRQLPPAFVRNFAIVTEDSQ
jgi:hypothetical protein